MRLPLEIAILIERFVPGAGGVENVAWEVAHELVSQGESVTVITRESAPSDRVSVVLRPVSRRWQPWRIRAFDRACLHAIQDSSGRRFDIVHGFARTRNQDLYRAGGGSHADYLAQTHTPWARAARRLSPRHRVLLANDRAVFSDPDQRIQCSSRLVADRLTEHEGVAPERIFLIPNAVDSTRFRSPGQEATRWHERAAAEQQWASGPLWLFAGSGWRRKGLEETLAALAHESTRHHRLWVAGRDQAEPWRERARRLGVAARVQFLGEQPRLEGLYAAVDGFVLPTRYDPFANVTLEAAAAGIPIVTSTTNGASEWLSPAIRVVDEPRRPEALAQALAEFDSLEHRQTTGEALARQAADFDWPQHVAALREEYNRIAERRAGAGNL